ncbi:MAG: Ig-like domain repeat protein [Lachnospiraceae bacterium]|nr:Ig-like domain repeat protein [Lachnospiraceae bacterium]
MKKIVYLPALFAGLLILLGSGLRVRAAAEIYVNAANFGTYFVRADEPTEENSPTIVRKYLLPDPVPGTGIPEGADVVIRLDGTINLDGSIVMRGIKGRTVTFAGGTLRSVVTEGEIPIPYGGLVSSLGSSDDLRFEGVTFDCNGVTDLCGFLGDNVNRPDGKHFSFTGCRFVNCEQGIYTRESTAELPVFLEVQDCTFAYRYAGVQCATAGSCRITGSTFLQELPKAGEAHPETHGVVCYGKGKECLLENCRFDAGADRSAYGGVRTMGITFREDEGASLRVAGGYARGMRIGLYCEGSRISLHDFWTDTCDEGFEICPLGAGAEITMTDCRSNGSDEDVRGLVYRGEREGQRLLIGETRDGYSFFHGSDTGISAYGYGEIRIDAPIETYGGHHGVFLLGRTHMGVGARASFSGGVSGMCVASKYEGAAADLRESEIRISSLRLEYSFCDPGAAMDAAGSSYRANPYVYDRGGNAFPVELSGLNDPKADGDDKDPVRFPEGGGALDRYPVTAPLRVTTLTETRGGIQRLNVCTGHAITVTGAPGSHIRSIEGGEATGFYRRSSGNATARVTFDSRYCYDSHTFTGMSPASFSVRSPGENATDVTFGGTLTGHGPGTFRIRDRLRDVTPPGTDVRSGTVFYIDDTPSKTFRLTDDLSGIDPSRCVITMKNTVRGRSLSYAAGADSVTIPFRGNALATDDCTITMKLYDKAGNTASYTYYLRDNRPPAAALERTAYDAAAGLNLWTNGSVTVTVSGSDSGFGLSDAPYAFLRENAGNTGYGTGRTLTADRNMTLAVLVRDRETDSTVVTRDTPGRASDHAPNVTKVLCEIRNIDKEPPKVLGIREFIQTIAATRLEYGDAFLDREEGSAILPLTFTDNASGLREVRVRVENRDNGASALYGITREQIGNDVYQRDGVSQVCRQELQIDVTEDREAYYGDFVMHISVSDMAGNVTEAAYDSTEFYLMADLTRYLDGSDDLNGRDDPDGTDAPDGSGGPLRFRAGESGLLSVSAAGYVDRLVITFPEVFGAAPVSETPKDALDLDESFSGGAREMILTREIEFMLPVAAAEGDYTIAVSSYKDGHLLKTKEIPFRVRGSVLEDLRSVLR